MSSVYGPRLSAGATAAASQAAFLERHAADLGIAAQQLVAMEAVDLMGGKFTLFVYGQKVGGIPVHGHGLKLLVRNDADHSLVLVHADAEGVYGLRTQPAVDAASALAAVRRFEPAATRFTMPELVYHRPAGQDMRLAWRFFGDNGQVERLDRWEFFVDAIDGTVVDVRPGICEINIVGNVTGFQSPPPLPDIAANPPANLPVYGARVSVAGSSTVYTDESGNFTLPHGGTSPVTVTVDLVGQWAEIIPDVGNPVTGSQFVTPPGPVAITLNPTPSQTLTSQVNALTHLTAAHDFVKSLLPSYTAYDIRVPAEVNLGGDICNATFTFGDPHIYFYRAVTGDCVNSAYASIAVHEYGHFVVDYAPDPQADPIDYHEGMADLLAALLNDDPCVGPDFYGQGTGCLRDLATSNRVYPDNDPDEHIRGLVVAGAFWDLREELTATEGSAGALLLTRELYIGQIFAGTHVVSPQITVDVLTLDDDDANLTNGTPHYFEICAAFNAHGLTCPVWTCDPQVGCDDGQLCNGPEQCIDNVCEQGALPDCPTILGDDGVDCTEPRCDRDAGGGLGACVQDPVDANCNDGVVCTDDVCDPLLDCQFIPNDANCDDGQFCNGVEVCEGLLGCQAGIPPDCSVLNDDGVACTDEQCDPNAGGGAGACVHVPNDTNCDDEVACTDDTCDDVLGCQFTPNSANCDDGAACTVDVCDLINDCQNTPDDGNCDDGVPCTQDVCDLVNDCQFTPIDASCDDGIGCTDDTCHPINGCQFTPNSVHCDDGVACTDNICDPVNGCQFTPNDANCPGFLLFCDGVETCNAILGCLSGPAPCVGDPEYPVCDEVDDVCVKACTEHADCDDGNVCTRDRCGVNVAGGCRNRPIPIGDATGDGFITLADLFCVLNGFQGIFNQCTRSDDDVHGACPNPGDPPCCPNGFINLGDLFTVLDGFAGEDACCGG